MRDAALTRSLGRAQALGFIGARPISDHLAQAGAMCAVATLSRPGLLVDLGSGGGVPGLCLGVELPDAQLLLVEAMAKRCTFLEMQLRPLGIEQNTTVVCGPAEDTAHDPAWRAQADVVTARGFGPPAMTAEIAAGFLKPAGRLIVTVASESGLLSWPVAQLEALGYSSVCFHEGNWPLVECEFGGTAPASVPRRRGLPRRRLLFGSVPHQTD